MAIQLWLALKRLTLREDWAPPASNKRSIQGEKKLSETIHARGQAARGILRRTDDSSETQMSTGWGFASDGRKFIVDGNDHKIC